MDRLTGREGKRYTIPATDGAQAHALDRLGRYEDLHEWLLLEKAKTEGEIEKLRLEGKQQSVKFKQLLAQKLSLGNTLALFEARGL